MVEPVESVVDVHKVTVLRTVTTIVSDSNPKDAWKQAKRSSSRNVVGKNHIVVNQAPKL